MLILKNKQNNVLLPFWFYTLNRYSIFPKTGICFYREALGGKGIQKWLILRNVNIDYHIFGQGFL